MPDWAKRFFRPSFFSPGQAEAVAAAPRETAFIWKAAGLRRGESVLDLCCGTGRHSALLARRGCEVVGLDATPAYLKEARKAKGPRFLRGDMRRVPFRDRFDAVVNLWTSFGYFPRLADDRRTLAGVARALKPGGRFLLDLVNADRLLRDYQRTLWETRADGARLLKEHRLRLGRDPVMLSVWTLLRPGRKPLRADLFLRLYSWERLARELARAGLTPVRRWGSLDGGRWSVSSERLVVLARKAG